MALSAFEIFGLVHLKPDLELTSIVSNTGGTPSWPSSAPVMGTQGVCVGMEQGSCPALGSGCF